MVKNEYYYLRTRLTVHRGYLASQRTDTNSPEQGLGVSLNDTINVPDLVDGVLCPNGLLAAPPRFIFSVEVTFATVGELASLYLHDQTYLIFYIINWVIIVPSNLTSVRDRKFTLASHEERWESKHWPIGLARWPPL